MREYFDEYKYSKYVLCKLVCQFYDYDLTQDKANELMIKYSDDDILNSLNYVSCVYHRYDPEGLYIWEILEIDKPIITLRQMWDITKSLSSEQYDEKKDYHFESAKLKLIDLYLVQKYYKKYIDIKDANECKIDYNYDLDEINGQIEGYDHLFESAGEDAWNLFGFEKNFIPYSKVNKIEKELQEELLCKDKCKMLKK